MLYRECSRKTAEVLMMLAAMLAVSVTLQEVRAESMHSMQALSDGATWAQTATFNNSLWVESIFNGVPAHGSGVALDPFNVLLSGHQVLNNDLGGLATSFQVGTGSNWMTDPGNVYSTSEALYHPLWDGTLFSQRVDLAILHFPGGIPGMDSLSIAGTSLGQQLRGAGNGAPAAGGSWIPDDEQERAFNWYVDGYGSVGGSVSTNYLRSRFLPLNFRNDPMAGGLTPGDSGMGVFDGFGNLVGLGVGYGGTPPGYGFDSFALRTELFSSSWIVPNMIPEPSTLLLAVIGMAGIAMRRRRA